MKRLLAFLNPVLGCILAILVIRLGNTVLSGGEGAEGDELSGLEFTAGAEVPRPEADAPQAERTALQGIRLRGTFVVEPGLGFAVIEDDRDSKQRLCTVGEEIRGAKIVSIEHGKICIEDENGRSVIELERRNGRRDGGIPAEGIKKVAEDSFVVDPETVTAAAAGTSDFFAGIAVSPHAAGGKRDGYLIENIPGGGFLEAAGLKSGDVMKSVNGMPLGSLEQLFEAYAKVKNEKSFSVTVNRGGRDMALNYAVEGD